MTDRPHRGGSFAVLRHRDFAIFWSAALVSNTGSWMQSIAVPFVIYEMTHSTVWLGFAAFMNFVPAMLVGPFAGSLADRYPRKRILLVTQTIMMISAFSLWAVWATGVATPWLIVGICFATGFVSGLNITTWQAFVTQLVGPTELVDAVRLNSMQFMGARAFGPALAGVVLQAFGPSTAFFANGVSFLLVLLALFMIRPRTQAFSTGGGRVLAHYLEGLRVVRGSRALLLPVLMIGVVSLLGTSVIQLAPAVAKSVFEVGRGAYGLLVAAFGVGAVVGSVLVATVADRVRRSVAATAGSVGLATGIVVLGFAPRYGVGVAAMFVMGASYLFVATSVNTGVQAKVSDEYRGRVMSIYLSSLLLGVPVGALIQGKLAAALGLREVIVGSGLLWLGFLGWSMLRFDRLRPLDEQRITTEPEPA